MKPTILMIHGFNISDGGQATVGELRGYCAALDLPYHIKKYGHRGVLTGLWQARLHNDDRANDVADFVKNSDNPVVLIGHSNGCNIAHIAMEKFEAKPVHCVYINPALDRHTIMPKEHCASYDVWHSPSDKPVKLARYLPKSQYRMWGDMGAIGATTTGDNADAGVINYNKEHDFEVSSCEHSDVFYTSKLSYFGPLILETALRRLH